MPRAELSTNSKWYIPKNLYKQCVYFCRQYPDWDAELKAASDSLGAIEYDKDRVQTSGDGDSTAVIAMRRYVIAKKKQLVDDAISETVKDVPMMAGWLLLGVTIDTNYWQLRDKGMPFGKNAYYDARRRFFYELSKKI